eukprot:2288027-Rhodomonas_salina.6
MRKKAKNRFKETVIGLGWIERAVRAFARRSQTRPADHKWNCARLEGAELTDLASQGGIEQPLRWTGRGRGRGRIGKKRKEGGRDLHDEACVAAPVGLFVRFSD